MEFNPFRKENYVLFSRYMQIIYGVGCDVNLMLLRALRFDVLKVLKHKKSCKNKLHRNSEDLDTLKAQ